MSAEQQLRELFSGDFADYEPSADLFARVERSIDDDLRRRAWRRRRGGLLAAAVLVIASVLGLGNALGPGGLDTSVLELVTLVTLIAVVVTLAPFIRRFGMSYALAVFAGTPNVGRSYVRLTEITYYLILLSYTWFVTLGLGDAADLPGIVGPDELMAVAAGLGGLLLLAGILHSVNLILLPIVARLLLLNRRYQPPDEE